MASRNAAEVVTGAAVLLLAGGFLIYAVAHNGSAGGGAGTDLTAKFDDISGVSAGSDVRIGGVKVGSVVTTILDPRTYQAVVKLELRNGVAVPKDSSAVITTDGLLGGKFVAIQPGGNAQMLGQNGEITVTQGSISLEALLGKFIFSASSKAPAKPGGGAAANP